MVKFPTTEFVVVDASGLKLDPELANDLICAQLKIPYVPGVFPKHWHYYIGLTMVSGVTTWAELEAYWCDNSTDCKFYNQAILPVVKIFQQFGWRIKAKEPHDQQRYTELLGSEESQDD